MANIELTQEQFSQLLAKASTATPIEPLSDFEKSIRKILSDNSKARSQAYIAVRALRASIKGIGDSDTEFANELTLAMKAIQESSLAYKARKDKQYADSALKNNHPTIEQTPIPVNLETKIGMNGKARELLNDVMSAVKS